MSKKLKYLLTWHNDIDTLYILVTKDVFEWVSGPLPEDGREKLPKAVVKQMNKHGQTDEKSIIFHGITKQCERLSEALGKTFYSKENLNKYLKKNKLKVKGAYFSEKK